VVVFCCPKEGMVVESIKASCLWLLNSEGVVLQHGVLSAVVMS